MAGTTAKTSQKKTGSRAAGKTGTYARTVRITPPDRDELAARFSNATVYLAEKHSIAMALADALPGHTVKKGGYIERGNTLITWLSGHLLELAPPEAYDPACKPWTRQTLPIVPSPFRLLPRTDRGIPQQLEVIKTLLSVCPVAVNAADFDREGQLLVDEVLELFRYEGKVLRLQTKALDAVSLRRELARMRPNDEFSGLRDAARARSQLDWLAGINLTRAMTLHGRSCGAPGLLSLGRVQTPTLALVVERDLAIENFVPKPFYKLACPFKARNGILATQLVTNASMPGTDSEKRLVDKDEAQRISEAVSGKEGIVKTAEKKLVKEAAPLPYNLTELQKEASARYGMGAQDTLAAAQALYEGKFVSYPRTDCQYLPKEQFSEAGAVLDAISQWADMAAMTDACDTSRQSACWNTGKVSAHHAIIPTSVAAHGLSDRDAKIYSMICRRYAWQFLPEHVFYKTKAEVECEGFLWRANGRIEQSPGWTAFKEKASSAKNAKKAKDEEKDVILPEVEKGEAVTAGDVAINEAMTTPPSRFTEGTLVDAMENIQRYIHGANADDQNILKKTEGLGTVATRASIIETLFLRHYLEKHGKALQSTPLGRDLVRNSPASIKDPLMTAAMERCLSEIQQGQRSPDDYVGQYAASLPKILQELFAARGEFSSTEHECPSCGKPLRRVRSAKGTWSWACSGAPECSYRASDQNGQPGRGRQARTTKKTGEGTESSAPSASSGSDSALRCPRCGSELVLRKSARGPFYGCSAFPSCRYTKDAGSKDAGSGQAQANGAGMTAKASARGTASPARRNAVPAERTPVATVATHSAATNPEAEAPLAGPSFEERNDMPPAWLDDVPLPEFDEGQSCAMPDEDIPFPDFEEEAVSAPFPGDDVTVHQAAGAPARTGDRAPERKAERAQGNAPNAPYDGMCPRCGLNLVRRNGRRGAFWGCSGFPRCRFTCDDTAPDAASGGPADGALHGTAQHAPATAGKRSQGSASAGSPATGQYACPACGSPLRQRNGIRGLFWGCSKYPSCRFTADDKDGKPEFAAGENQTIQ